MTDDDDTPQSYALPDGPRHPADLAARLMLMPEHRHLAEHEISLGYIMRLDEKLKGGKRELGSVHDVKMMFQGGFKDLGLQLLEGMLGHLPQFLVVLDSEFWAACADSDAEALLFHELCHVRQKIDKFGAPRFDKDGLPVYGIVEHDVTAFNAEVARYGAWSGDLREFFAVAERAR